MRFTSVFSIRAKLFLLLNVVAGGCILVVGYLLREEFAKDKLAYVYDSLETQTRSNATFFESEFKRLAQVSVPIFESVLEKRKPLSEFRDTISRLDIDKIAIIKAKEQNFEVVDSIAAGDDDEKKKPTVPPKLLGPMEQSLLKDALRLGSAARLDFSLKEKVYFAWEIGKPNEPERLFALTLFKSPGISSVFTSATSLQNFIVGAKGHILIAPATLGKNDLERMGQIFLNGSIVLDQDSFLKSFSLNGNWIAGGQKISGTSLYFVSLIPESVIEIAFRKTLQKVWYVVALILSLLIPLAVLTSKTMTRRVESLFQASQKLSEGNFDITLEAKSGDELQSLAQAFLSMAGRIKNLLIEVAHKARMEKELALAQTVQSTLFPPEEFQDEVIEIFGHYESASECGGDWWTYQKVGGSYHFCIADATGHGVPAALLTSAIQSAFTVISQHGSMSLAERVETLNKAIYQNAKGRLNMTMVYAELDSKTLELNYISASHEPMLLLRKNEGQDSLSRKNIEILGEIGGARLGENINGQYRSSTFQLKPNDSLVFYTDGILEVTNPEGKSLEERGFQKKLLEAFNQDPQLSTFASQFFSEIQKFKQSTELQDDVTAFIVNLKPHAHQSMSKVAA